MQKTIILICILFSLVFIIPIANAETEASQNQDLISDNEPFEDHSTENQQGEEEDHEAPTTIFNGPPPTIFKSSSNNLVQSNAERASPTNLNASNTIESNQVQMQTTGIPIQPIILAILLMSFGFIGLKIKK